MFKKIFAYLYPENSLDTDLRYRPIVNNLKGELKNNPKILEVGSGSAGITRYLGHAVTGTDKVFIKPTKLLNQVKVRGVGLPFTSNIFDYTISVDMLEHLPKKQRDKAIKEMIRVTKKSLFLATPCGKKAASQDKFLFDYYLKNHGQKETMLKEHLLYGLPGVQEIKRYLKNSGKKVSIKIVPNVNLSLRKLYMRSFFSNHFLFRKIFWLLLPLTHFSRFLNFGDCYRQIFFVKILTKK